MQAGVGIGHLAFPAFHLDDGQFALFPACEHPFPVEHEGQFPTGQTVDVWNLELAYKGYAVVFSEASFNLFSSQRVGAVQHDKLFATFRRSLHGQSHAADVGEGTAPDVLNVINKHVNVFQHLGCRLACLAVE